MFFWMSAVPRVAGLWELVGLSTRPCWDEKGRHDITDTAITITNPLRLWCSDESAPV